MSTTDSLRELEMEVAALRRIVNELFEPIESPEINSKLWEQEFMSTEESAQSDKDFTDEDEIMSQSSADINKTETASITLTDMKFDDYSWTLVIPAWTYTKAEV